jgi:hypothetical protein
MSAVRVMLPVRRRVVPAIASATIGDTATVSSACAEGAGAPADRRIRYQQNLKVRRIAVVVLTGSRRVVCPSAS